MAASETSRYCLTCSYVLYGLPEERCPECGRAFDSHDPTTFSDRPASHRVLKLIGCAFVSPWLMGVLAWVVMFLGADAFIVLLIPWAILAFGVQLSLRRWRNLVLLVVLCASPLGLIVWQAANDYWRGKPVLHYRGLPMTTFHNLDRQCRCERSSGGCRTSFGIETVEAVHNGTIRLLVSVCGPALGAYTGPYPEKADCEAVLAQAEVVPLEDLTSNHVTLQAGTFKLDRGVGAALLRRTPWETFADDKNTLDELGPIQGAVWQGCLILRIPTTFPDLDDHPGAMIAVFDAVKGRPFAYYGQGSYRHHFPPVRYHP